MLDVVMFRKSNIVWEGILHDALLGVNEPT